MANIAIINYCNLKCEYCFAENFKQQDPYIISFEEYEKLMNFAVCTKEKTHIGIIGGEPTLHPNFASILSYTDQFCFENNLTATLFTNGVELEQFLPIIGNYIYLLININSPSIMSDDQKVKLNRVLDIIFKTDYLRYKTTIGCNIHLNCSNYDFFWDVVSKYNIKKVRCSVVSPGGCYLSWKHKNKKDYYNLLKPIFLDFCAQAKNNNCLLNMDCNKIPICYFTPEELELVYSVCCNYEILFCEPVIDLIGNDKAISCFGANNLTDITQFQNIDELNRYLFLNNYDKIIQRTTENQCLQCNLFKLKQCQGGCLAFS